MTVVTDLSVIANAAEKNEAANQLFKERLMYADSTAIDDIVFRLNEIVTPQVDCTKCGNCCRSLMINVNPADSKKLAAHLNISADAFEEKYIEQSAEGSLSVMNAIPCHFLHDNKCIVYEARPEECRAFPGLHQPGFIKRLFATFMHYGRCPIIYNVIEQLKEEYTH